MSFTGDSIFWVEVEKVVPNPFQPRREFDDNRMQELAESVRMYGILQPLTVTRKEVPNTDGSFRTEYELIAGERRLRASKLAGLTQVPVIIRDGEQTEQEKLELAIIENLQREDLNSVDRALAFRQLVDVFGLSHTQVAKKMGRSREYVSNTVRLLMLPDYMLNSLRAGDISEGHARTLLMLNDRPEEQDTLFRETLLKKLSVREVERIARGIAYDKVRKKETVNIELLDLERQFTETLGTRVCIIKTDYGGKLTIDYFDEDDLTKLLEQMKQDKKLPPSLPPVGSIKDEMTLLEDKNAKVALELLTESTGLMEVTDFNDGQIADEQIDYQAKPEVAVEKTASRSGDFPLDETDIELKTTENNLDDTPSSAETDLPKETGPVIKADDEVTNNESVNPLKDQLASLIGQGSSLQKPIADDKLDEKAETGDTSAVANEESDLYSISRFTV